MENVQFRIGTVTFEKASDPTWGSRSAQILEHLALWSDIALFRNSTWGSGGSLEMPDGRKLPANINFSATRYQLMAQPGVPLLTVSRIGGLLHLSGDVLAHEAAWVMPELPWLVILGWYLTVMMHRDSAVAVAC